MSRIAIPTLAEAPAETRGTLEGVTKRLGWTPNVFRLMALSPNTLTAFVGLSGTLSRTLDTQSPRRIARSEACCRRPLRQGHRRYTWQGER
jgi:hypothetical protein